jgi:hypothetical protein
MRTGTLLVPASASALLLACNFIVASKFEETDGYSRDGGRSSSSSSSSSGTSGTVERPEPCAIGRFDGGEQCGECIEAECPAELDDACDPDPDGGRDLTESWWGRAKQCAQGPVNGGTERYSWGCDAFESLDAGTLSGDTPTARERRFMLCIKNKCVSGATPPCKQCIVKHNTGAEEVYLENSACGQCIRAECEPGLVKCCDRSTVTTDLPGCAYENGPQWGDCLQKIWAVDAGTTDECRSAVHVCIQKNCASMCPKP